MNKLELENKIKELLPLSWKNIPFEVKRLSTSLFSLSMYNYMLSFTFKNNRKYNVTIEAFSDNHNCPETALLPYKL